MKNCCDSGDKGADTSRPAVLFVSTVAVTLRAFYSPIARRLRELGVRVDCFANGASADKVLQESCDTAFDAAWTRGPFAVVGMVRAAGQLRRLVSEGGYCLVHVTTPIAAAVTRVALRGRDIPLVYSAHGFHFHRNGSQLANTLFWVVEKTCARWTRTLMVVNREDFRAARGLGMPAGSVILIPGTGVEIERFQATSAAKAAGQRVLESLGVAGTARVFLIVGEFITRKCQEDVLEAASLLREREFWLIFAGDGPLLSRCRRRAQVFGIAEKCRFLGFRSDIPCLLQAAFGLILASSQEGLPTCVIEAMASGIPVIASNIRGSADLVDQGCGVLFPVGDVRALAEAMRWSLDNPSEFAAMGRVGLRLSRRYSLERILRIHLGIYSRVSKELEERLGQWRVPRRILGGDQVQQGRVQS